MSKLGNLKAAFEYRGNVNRCANCTHFKQQSIRLSTNSETYRKNHHCGLGWFTITPNGVCKNWKGATP